MVTESDAQGRRGHVHRRESVSRNGTRWRMPAARRLGFVLGASIWMTVGLVTAPACAQEPRAPVIRESSRTRSPEARVLDTMVEGRLDAAAAALDSLLRADPADLTGGYLAARTDELRGRTARARCRYLELEAKARGTRQADLAFLRRRDLERRQADATFLGDGSFPEETSARGLLLLPLEDLSDELDHPYFGLVWTYLMQETLQGSGLCPVSIPATLLAVEQLSRGVATRAPASLLGRPINTTGGLRARLSVLPGKDGTPLLETAEGDWDESLRRALEGFQAERDLPVTGEADRTTLTEIERALDLWLRRPPALLAPALLASVMREVGATMAARGTYRFEGGRVSVQLSLIDLAGRPLLGAPVSLNFEPRETVRYAGRAAETIAEGAGVRLLERSSGSETAVSTLEAACVLLLLQDRGLTRLSTREWASLPREAWSWPAVERARQLSESKPADLVRAEEQLTTDWIQRIRLDAVESLDALMRGLDSGHAWDAETGPLDVLGEIGVIRVRGNAP